MAQALNARGVPIESKLSDMPFSFGNLTLTMINTDDPASKKKGR